jgi:hypothetical protein
MFGEVDPALKNFDALGFQQAALQRGVRFAQQNPAAATHDAMPRYSLAARSCRHGTPSSACTAAETQESSQRSIS